MDRRDVHGVSALVEQLVQVVEAAHAIRGEYPRLARLPHAARMRCGLAPKSVNATGVFPTRGVRS